MESTYLILVLLGGMVLGFVLSYFIQKANSVAKKDFNALQKQLQESITLQKVTEEKWKGQHEISQAAQQQTEEKSRQLTAVENAKASLDAQLAMHAQQLRSLTEKIKEQEQINQTQQGEILHHHKSVAELRAQNAALSDKLENQKTEMIEIQRTAHLQFEKIAQQIFEEKSDKFTASNKVSIETLLKPLGENIDAFKRKVEETYDKESKQRFSLEEKVKDLIETTSKISQEANNLTSALKGQAKKQGDWGETILESILEKSGLVKDREYFVQYNLKNEEGQNIRPDILVRLPDERNIVIDSKVSLNAYLRHDESESKEEQTIYLQQHIAAIKLHVDQLSQKKYQEYTSSLDFVIMFVPIEPAYLLAIQQDNELWSYAYSRRILLISPTNLIAVLKIIADLWKRETQNKNALAIAAEGSKLYDKLLGFLSTLEDIGKSITKTQDAYSKAVLQLRDGKGNLLGRAEKLKELGIKSNKKIPASFQALDPDEDTIPGLPHSDDNEFEE